MADNLWGDIPKPAELKTPVFILREQADLIFDLTGGLIKGRVSTGSQGGNPEATLSLVVPNLNNYVYHLVTVVSDPISIYPSRIFAMGENVWHSAADEVQFKATLARILSSPRTRTALNGLQTQAKAAEEQKK